MLNFYGQRLLAYRPTYKLDDHPLSVVCDRLFNASTDIQSLPSTTWGYAMPWRPKRHDKTC